MCEDFLDTRSQCYMVHQENTVAYDVIAPCNMFMHAIKPLFCLPVFYEQITELETYPQGNHAHWLVRAFLPHTLAIRFYCRDYLNYVLSLLLCRNTYKSKMQMCMFIVRYPREFSRLCNLHPWHWSSLLYGLISTKWTIASTVLCQTP